MSENLGLGKLITTPQSRDAIHIAVAPVVAGEILNPAQRIKLHENGKAIGTPRDDSIGIVDPFLRTNVVPGDTFWLWLIPGSVTSLRHAWTHPAFQGEETNPVGPTEDAKRESIRWLSNWAGQWNCSVDEVIDHANSYLDHGDYWIEGGRFEGECVPDEFWVHFQIVTGRVVPSIDQGSFFSCSC